MGRIVAGMNYRGRIVLARIVGDELSVNPIPSQGQPNFAHGCYAIFTRLGALECGDTKQTNLPTPGKRKDVISHGLVANKPTLVRNSAKIEYNKGRGDWGVKK